MAAIHYKSALCVTLTVCGQPINKLTTSFTEKPTLVTCLKCQKHQDVVRAHSKIIDAARKVQREVSGDRGDGVARPTARPPKSTVTISFEIEPDAAYEMAQFCKRLTWSHFAECAVGKDNAYQMRDAHGLLYAALREAGFNPR